MTHRGTRTHQGMRLAVDSGINAARTTGLLPYGYLRTIACPDCPADVGEPCRSNNNGKEMSNPHIARRRLATRKYRAEQGDAP